MKNNFKKIVIFSIILTFIFGIAVKFVSSSDVFAERNTAKRNPDSYWSEENAPIFYGATKITLKKSIIENFDVDDTRFRIFAKDFEDGDLTTEITHDDNVNINEVGSYEIHYQVTDSHGNTSKLTVPVEIVDDEETKIKVERTLYTIPSVWNMDIIGVRRCNYGDKQLLGIFLPAGKSIKARIISSDSDINIQHYNNDQNQEVSQTLKNNQEVLTIENVRDNTPYDSVPFFTSTVLSKDNTSLDKTWKVELEYDETIPELNYYHYQDNEQEFRQKWIADNNAYGVIENEVLTIVTPLADLSKTTNYHRAGFATLDEFLEYYQKAVDKMDEYIGLDLNPEELTDQNVRTRYLVRANAHGAGAAYYAGSHIGVNSPSLSSFFEQNWGGLHEIAHGYQGSFGGGEMQLGEVSNNILGHYIQIDKDIYKSNADWLGKLPDIEEAQNEIRKSNTPYTSTKEKTKLYFVINLFDSFEGPKTYAEMFKWYRREVNKGRTMTNQDAYVEAIADIYHVNIIPYMDAWGLNISDETEEKVYSKNYPMVSILDDITTDETRDEIMEGENMDRKYGLVTDNTLDKYDIRANLTINIKIDDINKLKNKKVLLKQNDKIIESMTVTSNKITFENVKIGTYYLQMPIHSDYLQNTMTVNVGEGKDNVYEYEYEKIKTTVDNNYLSLKLQGIYNTYGFELTFSDNYKKGKIHLNGSNMGQHDEIYVKIKDENGAVITEERVNGIYFDYEKEDYEVELRPGFEIEVKFPNYSKIKVYSTVTNQEVVEYRGSETITKYTVTENGLRKEGMSDDEVIELQYQALKDYFINIIKDYQSKTSDEELNNKLINFKVKSKVVSAYTMLREEDRSEYDELIERIRKGGSPFVITTGVLDYNINKKIDLYSLIYVKDNEDGEIKPTKENTEIQTDLNTSKKGQYTVKYTVEDSDNNKTEHTLVINISNDKSSSDNNVNDNKNNNTSDKNNSNSNSNSNKPNTNNTSQKTTKDKDEKVTDKSSNYNNSTTNSNVTNNNRSYSSKNYNSSENENEVEENDTVTKDDQEINNHDYEEETYNDGQKSLNKVENKKDGVKEKKDNNSIEYIVRIILIAITIVGLVEVICYNRKR